MPGTSSRPDVPRGAKRRSSLFARGEPMVWLTGGALVVSIAMIVGLLALVVVRGGKTFWPQKLKRIETVHGTFLMGELTKTEIYKPEDHVFEALPEDKRDAARAMVAAKKGRSERLFIRTGNRSPTNKTNFVWVSDFEIEAESFPEWAVTIERAEWGRFYGVPVAFTIGDERAGVGAEAAWDLFGRHHEEALEKWEQAYELEKDEIGALNADLEEARLETKEAEQDSGKGSADHQAAVEAAQALDERLKPKLEALRKRVDGLRAESGKYQLVMQSADGEEHRVRLVDIVRAYPANRAGWWDNVGTYVARWWEYLTDKPREANLEGGVWPAIFGTVVLTMIMTLLVVPFGVLGALYLREYAKQGALVSLVRIAVNNLAGVPSIVFGVFGFGFFCYTVGAGIDQVLFAEKLPNPTYGKPGILWASLTLALLTLPVVVVATEEALSAVPNSMREGSYACGASKWQTIRRIVLPRAMPGVMTGMILAIARGAGEDPGWRIARLGACATDP